MEEDSSINLMGRKAEYVSYVDQAYLHRSDKENLLDRNYITWMDSLPTYFWKGLYWFRWKRSDRGSRERFDELFAYDDSSKTLWQITNHELLNGTGDYITIQEISFFSDVMFLTTSFDDRLTVLVVNDPQRTIEKEIVLNKRAWLAHLYMKENKLFIVVQPIKRSFNIEYLFFFWWPKEPPYKWFYETEGKPLRYELDRDFNIISEQEIKEHLVE